MIVSGTNVMASILLFLKPTVFKLLLMAALVPAALLLYGLTLSPLEGSVRAAPVSTGTAVLRWVGRVPTFVGPYQDVRRRLDVYFQPSGDALPGGGFADNPSRGAQFLRRHLPGLPFTLPGQVAGLSLWAGWFHLLACVVARALGRV